MILKEHKNLVFLLAIFIISKLYFLHLPFYWDEAWSYIPAIKSILDNNFIVQPELLKGHPPLFYFSAAVFAKIFGLNVFSLHTFSLLITCFCLLSFYQIGIYFFKKNEALFLTVLLAVQPVFYVQSTMVLPEILLLSFFLQMIITAFQNRWKKYAFAGVLIVLTKETGLIIFGITTAIFVFQRKISWSNFYYLFFPIIAFSLFMCYNYFMESWFLYPTHIGLFHFDVKTLKALEGFFSFIFIAQGRNILTFLIVIIGTYLVVKKQFNNVKHLFMLFLVLFGYTLFSGFNFYSPRYMMVSVAILVLIFGLLVNQLILFNQLRNLFFLLSIVGSFWGLAFDIKENDYSLGYAKAVNTQKNAVQFLANEITDSEEVFCGFLSSYYINEKYLGYNETKLKASTSYSEQAFVLISSNESEFLDKINLDDYMLLENFGDDKIWVKIWKRKANSNLSF